MVRKAVRSVTFALVAAMVGLLALPGLAQESTRDTFPAWNECREACDRQFERDMEWCRKDFKTFVECKKRAMEDYAKCLAPCPPEKPKPPVPPICPG